MKTIIIICSIATMALATSVLAQQQTIKERLLQEDSERIQVMTADYRSHQDRVVAFIDRVQEWLMPAEDRGYYEAPEVTMRFFFENAEVVYEMESCVEAWMALPFEGELAEEIVNLESWMTLPFHQTGFESGPVLEAWMTVPFEDILTEEVMTMEAWMATPFEIDLSEENPVLESWMVDPFEHQLTEEPLALENWMSQPFETTRDCENSVLMATSMSK